MKYYYIKSGSQPKGFSSCCFIVYPELRNVKSFTRSKSSEPNFTPRKVRKSRQIQHLEGMKLTQKAMSGEEKVNILSYNPGLKTEFLISCSNLPKTILAFGKMCVLPGFLPQSSNPIFLHGYIRHIRDISQLCVYLTSLPRIPAQETLVKKFFFHCLQNNGEQ